VPAPGDDLPVEEAPASEAPGHPEIVRIRAPNPGPMTLTGTNTYVVGSSPAWIIDPGPADAGHIAEVRDVAETRGGIGGVVLTHSHSDHSGGVEMLGAGLDWGDASGTDEAAELAAALAGREQGGGSEERPPPFAAPPAQVGPFQVLPTPGHARDHVAFVLGPICFCGDLILGEGSTIVPPAAGGGSLADYMRSLELVEQLDAMLLCPGHGSWITDPKTRIEEYAAHRRQRETLLIAALDAGKRSQDDLLDAAWADVPAGLRPAAALALLAHLEKLGAEGRLPADLT
jgi:glyoxylase-like metal-dependent hydrolase (beta-lactamase superfamily II)